MYPTVAPFPPVQPHHRMHHHHPESLNQPMYDANDSHLPVRNDPSKPFFNPIPRPRIQLPHPVQRIDVRDASGSSSTGNGAEHTLRRKTPSGTLAAGYDGTLGDTIQPPATKHILVSPMESGQFLSPQVGMQSENWQFMPDQSATKQMNFPPVFKNDPAGNAIPEVIQDANGTSWVRPVNYPPGVDSMLNQSLPLQASQRLLLQNGQYVPTVLPATLQSCLGPTASAGTGPFGPYWPDGVYIPYRPAAFRDARFESPTSFTKQPNQPFYDLNQPGFHQVQVPLGNHADSGLAWGNPMPSLPTRDPLMKPHFPPRHSDQLPFHARANRPPTNFPPPQILNNEPTTWSSRPPAHGFQPPGPAVAANAEFKEKVLCWAHGVYVDLLATIHQARRSSISHGTADGHTRLLKPSIYPKPPRQPGLDFSQASPPDLTRHNSYPASQYDLQRQKNNAMGSHRSHDPTHPAVLPRANTRRPSLNQFTHSRGSDTHMLGLRDTGVSPFTRARGSLFNEGSPVSNAASALDMLSHLCGESHWEWIDGMLLGGCLAYGLGDYHKALRWNNRIIARDSTHVEAISNLAATLLALDRREEASQHWLRAVKLRPSFFEAVEHLIGLLCNANQCKEAVNIIDFVQKSLRHPKDGDCFKTDEHASEPESDAESNVSDVCMYDKASFEYDDDMGRTQGMEGCSPDAKPLGFASSGYAISGAENGRMLALVHAKGNMLYALGDNAGAAAAFEDAILIAAGRRRHGIQSIIKQIFTAFSGPPSNGYPQTEHESQESILLYPDRALQTAQLVFQTGGMPPGLQFVAEGIARNAATSTTSNALLSLAKIYQDGMTSVGPSGAPRSSPGVREILALYYLSLSLQPSPSTANNVGILLAGIQNNPPARGLVRPNGESQHPEVPGVVAGSGISLALAYYNYGLQLDPRHAHLYTNLGSLLKDIGQLHAAIKMYEQAVHCDGNFDIALANLANAVKDSGRVNDAITYYKRAVKVNPEFAEAVCGLANALNSVCNWVGRGGIGNARGFRDRWHVDEKGMLRDSLSIDTGSGWIKRVVDIVDRQLKEGEYWGRGILTTNMAEQLCLQLAPALESSRFASSQRMSLTKLFQSWAGKKWEGSRIVRLIERAIRSLTWQWYQDRYIYGKDYPASKYRRPQLPGALTAPNAPTVLPFHTFTCPLSAKQIRQISQRNGLRISTSTLRLPWLPPTVFPPPSPPSPYLRVGYVSSDFNNHPLAHLMQSVFGLHDPSRVKSFCYATTPSDKSVHRQQIEKEAPVFHDASGWPVDRLVQQIVADGIHILVNLNGYTRGARNEVFAARPAPIHMSFMGFAGTLGAEWCDYILADQLSIPPETLSPGRRNTRIEDRLLEEDNGEELEDWVYGEKIVFTRDTFFCCDHRQSAPDAGERQVTWEEEQARRWRMRKELFPKLSDDTIILGNFNQLYKIEPTTFRTWLRILARIPNAVLWLLRFPDTGEQNLRDIAKAWAGEETASRIIFTDVAPKNTHIARAKILDLFLDTPECNAHTTATDVLWSGTPLITLPRYKYKMCSRMASSILSSALPNSEAGQRAREDLIASSDEDYENKAIRLCLDLQYSGHEGQPRGRLADIRQMLFRDRYQNKLFDTARWVRDLEDAYEAVWSQWVNGEEGDIWL
ncbi:Tetratricopeptide-like helical [Penicillium paradoxum]|uniref:Tetratricopeptide-like helical n=1 Tax=Penicillium paradoxum TaxID=176176 RepID=UPI00254786DA|nr:Tetratricopeptide-like helical [Penicillium paradoxum]KAJ5787966.1 Tetratricopeptide-like helical [Penicillium paradoxum]